MRSTDKFNQFTRIGDYVLINFNERLIESEEGNQYEYDSTKVQLLTPRREVIQAIMRIKYPDMESEFAARINVGDEADEHEAWREQAKAIADSIELFYGELL